MGKQKLRSKSNNQFEKKAWIKDRGSSLPKKKMIEESRVQFDPLKILAKSDKDINQFLSKVAQNPDHFKDEMIEKIRLFHTIFEYFKEKVTARNEDFAQLCTFFANTVQYYRKDLAFLVPTLCDLLSSYATMMNPFVRMKVTQSLAIIAKQGIWEPVESISFQIKLFLIKDKDLRVYLTQHIISQIRKLSIKSKDGNMKTKLIKMFRDLQTNSSEKVAKRAFIILHELYRKKIWRDKKIGNLIADCCLNQFARVSTLACEYIIANTEEFAENFEISTSEDELGTAAENSKAAKHQKKTKAKENRV